MTLHRNRIALLCAAALLVAAPAHALRVATWNITNYQNGHVPSWITPRQGYFQTALAALNPDILITEEIGQSGSVDADSFLVNLNAIWPGQWQYTTTNITSTQSVVFWRSSAVSITNVTSFTDGGPREVLQCWVHPVGYTDKTATFRLYTIHLKAGGPATADSSTRRTECTSIRTTINNTPLTNYGPNFVIGGDTNFYSGYEGGYIRLTESQTNNNGQCRDTLNALNASQTNWHDNWYWRWYHSQSPC
ncbi:MAG TPA: hypothetical protein VMS88_08725, partial [Terriglobales bacterium]|nr:hypothetical protein [Terriglobales bacterium]